MSLKNRSSLGGKASEKVGVLPSSSTLVATVRNSAKALLVIGSLTSASCATMGYREMTLISEKCGSPEDCQDSLAQIANKDVDPKLDLEWLRKYSGRLNGSLETLEKDLLAKISAQEKSLLVIEKYKAPDWAARLQRNLSRKELKMLLEEVAAFLESKEDGKFAMQKKLKPSGVEKLKIMAQLSQELAKLKLELLEVKAKYPWFAQAEAPSAQVSLMQPLPDPAPFNFVAQGADETSAKQEAIAQLANALRMTPEEVMRTFDVPVTFDAASKNTVAKPTRKTASLPSTTTSAVVPPTANEPIVPSAVRPAIAPVDSSAVSTAVVSPARVVPTPSAMPTDSASASKVSPEAIDLFSQNPTTLKGFLPQDTMQNLAATEKLIAFLEKNKRQDWYLRVVDKIKKEVAAGTFKTPEQNYSGFKLMYDKYFSELPVTDFAELGLIVKNYHNED